MIAFLSATEMGSWDTREFSPVSRVRNQMRMNHSVREKTHTDPRMRADLKTLLNRLNRLRKRGGEFAKVELGPAVCDAAKSLKMVGTEMLVLYPERRGA